MLRAVISLTIIFLCLPVVVTGAVIHVPGDQPTIQAGIDAAVDGDVVLVAPGTYLERVVFNGKGITVRSEQGPEVTIIDGNQAGAVVRFENGEGQDSVLEGFTLTNGSGREIWFGYYYGMFAYFGGAVFCEASGPVITRNIIEGNFAGTGAGICCWEANPTISFNTIRGNETTGELDWLGGGIACVIDSDPTITNNTITMNSAYSGGGIYCEGGMATISDNTIEGNTASRGAGICGDRETDLYIARNLLVENEGYNGGGILLNYWSTAVIHSNTIMANTADQSVGLGGGVCLGWSSSASISHTIFWGNEASLGNEIYVGWVTEPSTVTISYSDVKGGQAGVLVDIGCTLNWGAGMIDADPLILSGPSGEYYLSQTAAGQPMDSPCVDAGDPLLPGSWGTTRTDHQQDAGTADLGFHYPGSERLVTGPGPAFENPPRVHVFPPFQGAGQEYSFAAYGAQHWGLNVTCGDVDGEGLDEIITGAGPGEIYGAHVRGFEVDGTPLAGLSFFAYGTPKWGVNVATGDIDGDQYHEIITGAGPGAVFGPHIRGWNYDGGTMVSAIGDVNYFSYGTPKWGVNISAGDIDGDGFDEIVSGAGPGVVYGPHVRGWNVDGGAVSAIPSVSFLAYGTNQYGVNVTCGDVDGDGIDEIVTGPGPGALFGAHVRGWDHDGSSTTPMPGFSFFAWSPDDVRFGARVFSGVDLDSDGRDELLVGGGPDPDLGTPVNVYQYDGTQVVQWFSLEAFPGMTHGTSVAAGRF